MENIEEKLDSVIDLLENQNELSERIIRSLSEIKSNIPETSSVDTKRVESILDAIWQKLDDLR